MEKLLSQREFEVVELVSKGWCNKDVADELGLTEGSVKQYLSSVFIKVGVTNRTELAVRFNNGDLLEYNPEEEYSLS